MNYQGNLRHHCSLYPGQPSVDWFRGQSSTLAIVGFIWETRFASGSIAIAVSNRQGTFTYSRNLHTPFGSGSLFNTLPRSYGWEGTILHFWYVCSLDGNVCAVSVRPIAISVATAIM